MLSPWKGVVRFGKKGKLSPRYIGSYRITEQVGEVAYRLELPSELSRVHNVFHGSMLRHYISDPSHVIPLQPLEINPEWLMMRSQWRYLIGKIRNSGTRQYVWWKFCGGTTQQKKLLRRQMTGWERCIRGCFMDTSDCTCCVKFRDKIFIRWVDCDNPSRKIHIDVVKWWIYPWALRYDCNEN